MFTNLTFLQEIYDVSITWNFFATSHGKGAVDGIGGDVKRRVWLANLTGDRASDAESFARIAAKHCKKTEVQLVLASEIMEGTAALEDRWLNILSLPKTHMMHCVIPVRRYVVKCSTYSSADHFNTISLHPDYDLASDVAKQPVIKHDSARIGDFIVVEMCGKKTMKSFVAQVVDSSDDCLELSFLRKADLDKSGRAYVFPVNADKSWINLDEVVRVLSPPSCDNRNHYIFDEKVL
jgi:hypothetical protein